MRFVYPYILLILSALPIIGLVWMWIHRRSVKRLDLLIAPSLQKKLMPSEAKSRFSIQFFCAMLGLALLVIAAARPQWGRKDERVVARGRNVVIALDVSRSMLAADVHPNRLERAKTDIMDLIDDLKGDRAALLAFRNKGSLICPLTTDYAFLRQALDGATPESAPRGETDLGDAIRKSLEALDPALDEYNAILMISDGEDLKGGAIAAAQEAAKRNIPIFTVGIGDPAGASIPDPDGMGIQKYKGNAVKTRLTDKTLSAIAGASNGRYIPFGTAGTAQTTLGAIYRRHLSRIASREQQELIENRLQERYQLFLVPAIALLMAVAGLSRGQLRGGCGKRLTPPAIKTAAAILLGMVSGSFAQTNASGTSAQDSVPANASSVAGSEEASVSEPPPIVVEPGRAGARTAQKYFRSGKYRAAAEAYLSATRGADRDEGETYRYNAALAWYKAGELDRASETLLPLMDSKRNGAKAGEFYGKIQMGLAKKAGAEDPDKKVRSLEEAAGGFQRSLRDLPGDERRNRNLTRSISPLAEARDAAKIARVMKEHGKTPMPQLLTALLNEQRAIMTESEAVFTNNAPEMIAAAEAMARRQEKQAELWIPLKQQLLRAVTNQQQRMHFARQIELLRDSMNGAAEAWRDVIPDAMTDSAQSEPTTYQFWKMAAGADALLNEDILCQSNSVKSLDLVYYKNRDTQAEAKSLSDGFLQRFPQWAEGYRRQAQSDTNMPPFTAEDQKKIERLVTHARGLQKEIIEKKPALAECRRLREQALRDLLEAQAQMPKRPDKGRRGQQNQRQNQQQKQDQKRQDRQRQEDRQQQQKQEGKKEQQQQENKKKERPPEDVRELLRRALNREKEHEDEKKERMRKMPMAPNGRDW